MTDRSSRSSRMTQRPSVIILIAVELFPSLGDVGRLHHVGPGHELENIGVRLDQEHFPFGADRQDELALVSTDKTAKVLLWSPMKSPERQTLVGDLGGWYRHESARKATDVP